MKATKTMPEQVLSTGPLSSFRGWLTCMRQNQAHLYLVDSDDGGGLCVQ